MTLSATSLANPSDHNHRQPSLAKSFHLEPSHHLRIKCRCSSSLHYLRSIARALAIATMLLLYLPDERLSRPTSQEAPWLFASASALLSHLNADRCTGHVLEYCHMRKEVEVLEYHPHLSSGLIFCHLRGTLCKHFI